MSFKLSTVFKSQCNGHTEEDKLKLAAYYTTLHDTTRHDHHVANSHVCEWVQDCDWLLSHHFKLCCLSSGKMEMFFFLNEVCDKG